MNIEYETQVLDIDKQEIIEKLRALGAKEEKESFERRWIFDMSTCNGITGEWIRLRQIEGSKPTVTYKNKKGKGVSDTEELEIVVDDYEKAEKILSKLSFVAKYYQEKKRHKFFKDGIEYALDTWPLIPTYLEIEAKSEKKVHEGLKLLGLTDKDSGHLGPSSIHQHYGIDLHALVDVRFEGAELG